MLLGTIEIQLLAPPGSLIHEAERRCGHQPSSHSAAEPTPPPSASSTTRRSQLSPTPEAFHTLAGTSTTQLHSTLRKNTLTTAFKSRTWNTVAQSGTPTAVNSTAINSDVHSSPSCARTGTWPVGTTGAGLG